MKKPFEFSCAYVDLPVSKRQRRKWGQGRGIAYRVGQLDQVTLPEEAEGGTRLALAVRQLSDRGQFDPS